MPQQHQPQKQMAMKTTDKPPGHVPWITNSKDVNTKKATYAQASRQPSILNPLPSSGMEPTQVFQDLLIKQSEKIDFLLQQISSLMSLIVTLVGKSFK